MGISVPHEADIESLSIHTPKSHKYEGNIHEGEYVSVPSRPLPISSTSGTPGPETPNRITSPDFIASSHSHSHGHSHSHSRSFSQSQIHSHVGSEGSIFTTVHLASNERNFSTLSNGPTFVHKWTHTHSILCVIAAPSKNLLICGAQDSRILLYDMNDYSLKHEIFCGSKEHVSSVLCLALSEDENYLFSAGSDSLVKVWDLSAINATSSKNDEGTKHGEIHCSHIIYSLVDIGDIFSIAWSNSLSTLFIGAQNASILWCPLEFEPNMLSRSNSVDSRLEKTMSKESIISNDSTKYNPSFLSDGNYNSVNNSTSNVVNGHNYERLPHFRYDKFFDSKGPGGSINYLQTKHKLHKEETEKNSNTRSPQGQKPKLVEIRTDDIIRFAHNGYVYCMEIFNCKEQSENSGFLQNYEDTYDNLLISCGGDGIVNLWGTTFSEDSRFTLTRIASLDSLDSILSMAVQDSYIYAGLSNSTIKVWDLCTLQLIRSFKYEQEEETSKNVDDEDNDDNSTWNDEILSLGIHNHCIFKASNKGGLSKLTLKSDAHKSAIYEEVKIGEGSDGGAIYSQQEIGPVLAVRIFTNQSGSTFLLSGCNKSLGLWDITNVGYDSNRDNDNESVASFSDFSEFSDVEQDNVSSSRSKIAKKERGAVSKFNNNSLLKSLQKYITYKTISRYPALYVEDSRHCAQFLTKLLASFGAKQSRLLPVENGNPIVYAVFEKNSPTSSTSEFTKRLLWYAHYDVVDAEDDWTTDPFSLTAKNGNLYGRGVSDNKGPTLAAIYSTAELLQKKQLSCDVVFIIEGEEECGSIGFQKVINANKDLIGHIDWVMLSNSYWLDDEIPCLNYGLRGVINASISVKSRKPDRHSGVDGGVSQEPTMNLIQILGKLIDPKTNEIQIPHFYDDVLPLTEKEIEIYTKIEKAAIKKQDDGGSIDQDLKTLLAKWRNPSLTVHKIEVSGPNNNTVIPQVASASISIRVVPNQDLTKIKSSLIRFLNEQFEQLNPPEENQLSIDIFHESEPWLGDLSNIVYSILYDNLIKNWGPNTPEPLFIREGGSIPSIRFLEKCFKAPAAQIPCGQASDNAHLKDEKLRVLNLFKLKNVLLDTFRELGHR